MSAPSILRQPHLAAEFEHRHIGPSPHETAQMLAAIGAESLSDLMAQTLPASLRQEQALDVGPALSEVEALERMSVIANRNQVCTSLIGQ